MGVVVRHRPPTPSDIQGPRAAAAAEVERLLGLRDRERIRPGDPLCRVGPVKRCGPIQRALKHVATEETYRAKALCRAIVRGEIEPDQLRFRVPLEASFFDATDVIYVGYLNHAFGPSSGHAARLGLCDTTLWVRLLEERAPTDLRPLAYEDGHDAPPVIPTPGALRRVGVSTEHGASYLCEVVAQLHRGLEGVVVAADRARGLDLSRFFDALAQIPPWQRVIYEVEVGPEYLQQSGPAWVFDKQSTGQFAHLVRTERPGGREFWRFPSPGVLSALTAMLVPSGALEDILWLESTLGALGNEALVDAFHLAGCHPVSGFDLRSTTNYRQPHGHVVDSMVMYLHDSFHALWASYCGPSERKILTSRASSVAGLLARHSVDDRLSKVFLHIEEGLQELETGHSPYWCDDPVDKIKAACTAVVLQAQSQFGLTDLEAHAALSLVVAGVSLDGGRSISGLAVSPALSEHLDRADLELLDRIDLSPIPGHAACLFPSLPAEAVEAATSSWFRR